VAQWDNEPEPRDAGEAWHRVYELYADQSVVPASRISCQFADSALSLNGERHSFRDAIWTDLVRDALLRIADMGGCTRHPARLGSTARPAARL
jgi:hypothetical protein